MPNMLAHCLCGDKAALVMDGDRLRKIINAHHNVFMLGCQGPDYLLYYHANPLKSQKRAKEVQHYGSVVHCEKVNEFMQAMAEKAKSDDNEVEMAYVAGFLCHHALDAIAHPYVNYRTGSATKKTGYAHQLLEAQMDTGLMDYYKLLPSEYNPYKLIRISRKDMECLAHFSHQLLNQVYGFNEEYRVIYECYHDTQSIQHVLSDPKSNKYNIISKLENLMNIPGMATSMMIPWKYDDKLDAANFRKDVWKHSVTGEEHNESFLEMFDKAVQESLGNLNSLNDFFFADGSLEPILKVMADRSYDSGIRGGRHKYFKADEE